MTVLVSIEASISLISTTEIYTHLSTEDLRKEILEHHPRNIRWQQQHDNDEQG